MSETRTDGSSCISITVVGSINTCPAEKGETGRDGERRGETGRDGERRGETRRDG